MGNALVEKDVVLRVIHLQDLQQVLPDMGDIAENVPVADARIQGVHPFPVLLWNEQGVQHAHLKKGLLQAVLLLLA